MQLTNRTIQVLKNFSTINQSLLFEKGDILTTMSASSAIVARAKLDQEFPKEFAIFELSRFLNIVSLMGEPSLEFMDKFVQIKNGAQYVNYTYCAPDMILTPPKGKSLSVKDPYVSFVLKPETLTATLKAASVLSTPEIAIVGDGEKLVLRALDSKNASADRYNVELREEEKKFSFIFKTENIKIIPDLYTVSAHINSAKKKMYAYFQSETNEYWIAASETSSYE